MQYRSKCDVCVVVVMLEEPIGDGEHCSKAQRPHCDHDQRSYSGSKPDTPETFTHRHGTRCTHHGNHQPLSGSRHEPTSHPDLS